MNKTAKLFATVTIYWIDYRGYEHDARVDVDYTFDGERMNITGSNVLYTHADDIPDFDELVWEAVGDQVDEAYAEWLADLGDYLHDRAMENAL